MRYLAVLPPTPEKDRAASRFGLNTHGAEREEDYALIARLGAGWIRGLTLWHFVQAWRPNELWQDKPINWERPDRELAWSRAHGLNRMGALFFSVACASSSDPHHKNWWGQSLYPPDDLTQDGPYATWVREEVGDLEL